MMKNSCIKGCPEPVRYRLPSIQLFRLSRQKNASQVNVAYLLGQKSWLYYGLVLNTKKVVAYMSYCFLNLSFSHPSCRFC